MSPTTAAMLSGAPGAIDPTTLSDLWVYHKPGAGYFSDLGSTPQSTNGGLVEQWNDASSGVHHLAQTTSGHRPTLDTAVQYKGKNTLQFDPTTAYQALLWPVSSLPGTTAVELFIILKARSNTPAAARPVYTLSKEGSGGVGSYYPTAPGHIFESLATTGTIDLGAAPISLADDFHTYNVAIDASGLTVRLDNAAPFYSDGTTRAPVFNKIQAYLGVEEASAFGFSGWIAAVCAIKRLLTTAERNGVYLAITNP